MSDSIRTRFAPSPTGYLHLGNVRTALFNALAAQAVGGQFVLRVEDTDTERSRPEWADALFEDLRWLGIEWDEGPLVQGWHAPYKQSDRAAIYDEYFDRLIESGSTYPCFCTPKELEASRKAQLAAGKPPRYRGTCAHLSGAEVAQKQQEGRAATLRFRVPRNREIRFDDIVRGRQTFASNAIGDFIIRRTNGTSAFFFSNAVDDALMGITHVLRGDDHLTNTPRQLLLMEAFGLTPPRYGHLGLLVGDDGAPLSKRHGSASVRDLRHDGLLPEAVINYLARLGHHYVNDPGPCDFATLASNFDLHHLSSSPSQFDPGQLQHWQKEGIEKQSDAALWRWALQATPALSELVPDADTDAFTQAIRHNITRPEGVYAWATAVYRKPSYSREAETVIANATTEFFNMALQLAVQDLPFKPYAKQLQTVAGVKGKHLYMPLRAALTGETHGPEIARIWDLLGVERVRERLEAARTVAQLSSTS